MKIQYLAAFSFVLALSLVLPASAQVGSGSVSTSSPVVNNVTGSVWSSTSAERAAVTSALDAFVTSKTSTNEAQKLALGKVLLQKQVALRQAAMSRLSVICSSLKNTNTSDTTTSSQITAVQTNLSTELTQTNLITSSEQVKSLSTQILESNRVYAIVSPGVRGECNSSNLLYSLTNTVNPLVVKLKSLGEDTTKLEGYLTAAKAAATSANDLYKLAVDSRALATTTLTPANDQLKSAASNLDLAAAEAKILITAYNASIAATGSGSTATPVTTQ